MSQMCPLCGAVNSADNEFCGSCRAYLGWDRDTENDAARPDGEVDAEWIPPVERREGANPPDQDRHQYDAPTEHRAALAITRTQPQAR